MSYSYIKSVFPKFESSKIYDERIYNSLSTMASSNIPFQPSAINEQLQNFTQNLAQQIPSTQSSIPPTIKEEPKETIEKQQVSEKPEIYFKDNLKFYNKPIPEPLLTELYDQQKKSIEGFSNCTSYTDHVLSCQKCTTLLSKQLGINNDKARLEEFMELGSYIVFGIFILLVLESLKKK